MAEKALSSATKMFVMQHRELDMTALATIFPLFDAMKMLRANASISFDPSTNRCKNLVL
jgi:c-di-AMP phosphodiesterase-like protein